MFSNISDLTSIDGEIQYRYNRPNEKNTENEEMIVAVNAIYAIA